MAYYESQPWSAGGRQPSWEQQPPPSRSGASSTVSRDDPQAFASQFEEVERAQDNLVKSGKMMGMPGIMGGPGRRDSMPMGGRPFENFGKPASSGRRTPYSSDSDPRMGGPSRHHSMSEYEGARPGSASNLQSFYANQRYHGRGSEADQMIQAKRRMAAQRERELRNYHQEQQYNRNVSAAKSDRSMSPNVMNEDERKELLARQHRALYGNESNLYTGEASGNRPISQDARVTAGMGGPRNGSPLAYDPYSQQSGQSGEPAVQMPPRDQGVKDASAGAESNNKSSPSSNPTAFGLFENAQQSSRTSTASPTGGSPPRGGAPKGTSGVAPIGTRPPQNAAQPGAGLNKRSTTPLPSPLSYGFTADNSNNQNNNERSTSASSNPSSSVADKGVGLGWGSNSAVWGGKNTLGVQGVWG